MDKPIQNSSLGRNKRFMEFLRHFQPGEVEKRAKEDAETKRVTTVILESGLFDSKWYRQHYLDVERTGMDPVIHYIKYGAHERRDPGPYFSTARYLTENPGLNPDHDNPLYHYIVHGSYRHDAELQALVAKSRDSQLIYETIASSPYFDSAWYLANHPDVAELDLDPIEHFIAFGAAEMRRPGPQFDTRFYVESYRDVAGLGINPLYHFIRFGKSEGRIPVSPAELGGGKARPPEDVVRLIKSSGLFDSNWYLKQNPDVERAGVDAADHFVRYGAREGRFPNANFMTQFYAAQMTEEEQRVFNALEHYILLGQHRGYLTTPRQMQLAKALPIGALPRLPPDDFSPGSIAIMAHVFYVDMCSDLARAFANMPFAYDLLVSTDTAEKKSAIENAFAGLPNAAKIDVRVVANRGRDVAPLVVEFGRACLEHDFVLHVHSKKSPYGDETFGWFDHCLGHLLHSPLYIDSLFRRFVANPTLGIIFPPPFPGIVRHMHWAYMKAPAVKMLSRIGLPATLIDAFPLAFPAGSMMWFRTEALKPLFESGIKLEEFPEEQGQKNDTLAHIIERLFFYISHHQGFNYEPLRPAIENEYFLPRLIEPPKKPIHLPKTDTPEVSIVVPVYNQWSYTSACLASIAMHTDGERTPYEVILADDGSDDETTHAEQLFPGLRYIRTPQNLGFLGNCNNAAEHCRGQYILFLNNDTQVQPGWLDALLEVFRQRADAAVVGSKLIYPDGTLQEAGGIIWRNAGGMNYGRNKDPAKPPFCYVKESDYVSGAALMVSASFLRDRGGFDTRFSPAYYEDTDLCFQARQAGKKVYFQPASLVVHFEGKSHGTDTSTGVKRHQVANRDKFRKKWATVLASNHLDGKQLQRARERSEGRKVIAVFDYVLPEYDRHAGARYTYSYMKLLLEHGYLLKFFCCKLEEERQIKFATHLQQLGIETFYPTLLGVQQNWNAWIAKNAANIDGFLLNRPNAAGLHMMAAQQTGKPILYFCHDLQTLRESREAELQGNSKRLAAIKAQEQHEIGLFRGATAAYTPSSYELDYLQKTHGLRNVILHPVFLFDEPPQPRSTVPAGMNVIFVGGMRHMPNSDGILWFLREIWPEVVKIHPAAQVHIVGTGASVDIMAMASPNVVLHGGVDDAVLKTLYAEARAAILPLRYGAGVKGKLIEAFQNRLPVVSTGIGLEGVPGISKHIPATDAPVAFATALSAVLAADEAAWLEAANNLAQFGYQNFSRQRGWDSLRLGLARGGLLDAVASPAA